MTIEDLFAKAKKKVTSPLLGRMLTADDPDLFEWPDEPKKDE